MLQVDGLTVSYGSTIAVEGLTLTAHDREVLAIIGPSGCGKSTLLRAISGLVAPRAGTIRIAGESVDGRRPDERRTGLMFQDHALFPHRSVGENVGFGPRMQGLAADRIDERVRDALELVDLAGTEQRRVTELSGGEQQRVALARAIAPRPRLLLLDEPLGSLDRALRDRLLQDLPRVFERIEATVVYVTHDQDEALALGHRIAVMRAGRLEQIDRPDALWRAPRSVFVARFLGLDHLFDARIVDGVAHSELGALPVGEVPDGPTTLVLRADALRLVDGHEAASVAEVLIDGVVVSCRFAGDHLRVEVATELGPRITVRVWRGPERPVGSAVTVAIDPAAIHLLD